MTLSTLFLTIFLLFSSEVSCKLPNFFGIESRSKLRSNGSEGHSSIEIENDAGMEFCDGSLSFKTHRQECKWGYQFGPKIPQCICFKGLYRMILDDCFESDGISEEKICTRPFDTQRESGAKIFSVQITQEINWDHTTVACERLEPDGSKIWAATTLHGSNSSIGVKLPGEEADFYVINGVPYVEEEVGGKQSICVAPKYVESFKQEKICRYFRNDNEAWKTESAIDIIIKKGGCDEDARALIPSECFPSVRDDASECHLECDDEDMALLDPRSASRGASKLENCTDDAELLKHDNLYLDRQMLLHSLMINLNKTSFNQSALFSNLEPNRTFNLFRRMVNITTAFCPDSYVPNTFIDTITQLFYVVHKGREFKYEEAMTEDEYNWAISILENCQTDLKPIMLTPNLNLDERDKFCDDEKAYGFCRDPSNCTSETFEAIEAIDSKKGEKLRNKHYVPELSWNILDITQAICFSDFNSSYRIFHVVQQAVEKLFTTQIKNLWYFPPYNDIGSRTKVRLLGAGADETMFNLEICTAAIYEIVNSDHLRKVGAKATKLARLKRPSRDLVLLKRKKRNSGSKSKVSISPNYDAYCLRKSKDWIYPQSCFAK